MAINVSAYSIRRPLPAIVLALVLLALGMASFKNLPITLLPNVDQPIVTVVVSQFGASPAELETQVTKPVEDAISGVEGVRHILSQVTDAVSVTTITLALGADTDRALNDVKDAVTRIRGQLPRNINEPLIRQVGVVGASILAYAAVAPGKTPEQLSNYVDEIVKPKLQEVRGVGNVERIGGVDREILVSLDPARLAAFGLTAADVSRRLRGTNLDLAGGQAELGGQTQSIRTLAGARTLDELAGSVLALPKGGAVRLDELGVVTDTIAEPRTFARLDGEPIVAFSIQRSKGASDVTVAAEVEKRIEALHAARTDIDLKLIDTSVAYTLGNYHSAMSTLFEGALLAVIVVFLFLRDLRATVIAAIALPLSIIPAFFVMDVLGFSLNLVSLLAITLATGILVDDAIVEIENIVRHIRMGKSAFQAAIDAADEIGLAVIAISLTIVAVFAPVSFMNNIAGQYFKQFGLTVSAEVLFSLLAARLITPMLAAYFLKAEGHQEEKEGKLTQRYAKIVAWSVERRYSTVVIGLVLFALSILSTKLIGTDFQPTQDAGRSHLAIELPAGSTLSQTQGMADDVSRLLRQRSEVTHVFIDGGHIPPSTSDVRKASIVVNYTPRGERAKTVQQLEAEISRDLNALPDIRSWFVDDYGQRPVSYVVTGPDSVTVATFAAELAAQMNRIPALANVIASTSLERPELLVRPDRDLAARLGVSTEGLSETLRVATIGDVGPALAKFNADGRQIPIRAKLDGAARSDKQVLESIGVPTGAGPVVPLSSIAQIELGQGEASISRFDREREAQIQAALAPGSTLSEAEAAIYDLPLMKNPPPGIRVGKSGDAEAMAELFAGFAEAMRNGLIMVYAVLVVLFASFLQPVTILFSLPLSIGGAIFALLITSRPVSMPVIIGILMLMGIVTKNAIMLVDFSIEAMRSGMERTQAIVEAGKKRARPIVMTTIAMVAGMVPSALAIGAGGEFRAPMAIAVIGGLIVSTVLSLLFVPAFFAMMDDVGRAIGGLWRRFVTERAGTAPAKKDAGPAE
ncbi:acriflavin resistance protein [Methylocella silvestris BL2]|uniref:Acriflavin resistance protein n=1 Tax=Methylocella silvestris (strain DSM 15510 / CIP 108128 / LMG 27833 / NCIMB 13906 / BL2) TaxID=395965 RepID=B8ENQ1_METSB|nr:efflux RND transporter permease subunit [Methylocella silvestris]ACK50837.1 acriflavin resistance protein [Methylocella silvestris BL2]